MRKCFTVAKIKYPIKNKNLQLIFSNKKVNNFFYLYSHIENENVEK